MSKQSSKKIELSIEIDQPRKSSNVTSEKKEKPMPIDIEKVKRTVQEEHHKVPVPLASNSPEAR